MKKILLNIGCGKVLLEDFINIDLDSNADLQLNITEGLPFDDNTVDGIYSEHFIEHLSQSEGVSFLRECRRVLKPNGIIRIATPDMEFNINRYIHADWAEKTELHKYGFDWIANSAEYMNIAMREWGHKWIYNEDELIRVLKYAGFDEFTRCELNKSNNLKEFNDLETRISSKLIIESVKVFNKLSKNPLVSVLIPAYRHNFFRESLESAILQTYENIEIIIFDDSRDDLIENIVIDLSKKYKNRIIKYKKNKQQFGEKRNSAECWNNSTGELIKFLNDDDVLKSDCIEKMVYLLEQNPQVSLITSKRDVIDENGNILPDIIPTKSIANKTGVINGIIAMRTMLDTTINYIGEPSTALFRRNDLIIEYTDDIRSFAGRHLIMNGDVGMWMKLLCCGDLLYIVEPLSQLRIHKDQVQNEQDMFKKGKIAWQQAVFDAKRMGIFEKYYPIDWEQNKIAEFQLLIKNKISNTPFTNGEVQKSSSEYAISIIIPAYNKIEYTRKCIAAIFKNTESEINYEIIIVDNNSTDDTADYLKTLKEKHTNISVITNSKNLGFSKANNQAAKIAKGGYLLFLNNDTEVEENWLPPLVEILKLDPSVGAVGAKLLFPDRRIQHAGVIFYDDTLVGGEPLIARHIYYLKQEDFGEANELRTYKALTAACLLIPKSIFNEFNGLDEGFWNGYEDVDLCLKMHYAGYKLVYQPNSVVIHHESQSGPERFSKIPENVKRLNERWLNKNVIDVIQQGNDTYKFTETHGIKQYHIPSKPPQNERSLVSVIILTYNALVYTKKCVDSIIKHTNYPYEIIFVDNNSTDGTKKYLRQLAKKHNHITAIFNKQNKGFAAGNNQAVKKSKGDYVMILNNDVLVGQGWLSGMVEAFEKDNRIGMVGPLTNSISGLQMVTNVPYKDEAGFYKYAAEFQQNFSGNVTPRRRIAGFAVLMKKALYEDVKGFDVAYGTGNYEDDDLCLKVRHKGYAIMVDEGTFIHHYGSQTFKANKIDILKSLEEKGDVFKKKWPDVDYEELLEMKNQLSKLHQNKMEVAIENIQNGNYENAWELYTSILSEHPIHSEALLGAAMCSNQMQDFNQTLTYLNKLVQLEPDNAHALNQSGLALAGKEDFESAKTAFALAIEKDPQLIDAQRNYADTLIESGDYENGVKTLAAILKNHPDDIPTLLYMSEINLEAGHFKEAQEYAEKALHLEPENELTLNLIQVIRDNIDVADESKENTAATHNQVAKTINDVQLTKAVHPVFCIGGMHRSGTSLLTQLLYANGVSLGSEERLLKATDDNSQGYWENTELVKINEAVLNSFGLGWDYITPLPQGWENDTRLEKLKSLASQILKTFEFNTALAWKDPRNSITYKFWNSIIPDLKIIIVYRNPVEVAHSLITRNRMSVPHSLNLWHRYNESIIEQTKQENRLFINYDKLMSNPGYEVNRAMDWLGLKVDEKILKESLTLARMDLKHHSADHKQYQNDENFGYVFQLYNDIDGGKYSQQSLVESAAGQNTSNSEMQIEQANSMLEQGNAKEAYAIYQDLIGTNPADFNALFGMAIVSQLSSDFAASRKWLKKAIEIQPNFLAAYNMLGNLDLIEKNPDGAIPHFQKSLEIDAAQPDISNALANAFIDTEQFDTGIQMFINTIQEFPDHINTLKSLGLINLEAGKNEDALVYFRKIMEYNAQETEISDLIKSIEA